MWRDWTKTKALDIINLFKEKVKLFFVGRLKTGGRQQTGGNTCQLEVLNARDFTSLRENMALRRASRGNRWQDSQYRPRSAAVTSSPEISAAGNVSRLPQVGWGRSCAPSLQHLVRERLHLGASGRQGQWNVINYNHVTSPSHTEVEQWHSTMCPQKNEKY
jgi:hypothetical protein